LIFDDFVINPISALRFIPHSAGIARLELGLITKSSLGVVFYEFINPNNSEVGPSC
jgi:hypothetical protein